MAKKPRASRSTKIQPAMAWAAVSKDRPPQIWHVAWYRDHLERQDMKHIRVRIVPVTRQRKVSQ